MYNYPLTGSASSPVSNAVVSSLPIGCSDLQHSQPAYTSLQNMSENWRFSYNNTGRPFKYSWINSESSSSTVLPAETSVVTQSWALTSNASNYTGSAQFIT